MSGPKKVQTSTCPLPDDGGAEGPERGAEARSAGAPRGVGSGEGRRSPSPVWGSGGYAPRKFFKKSTLKSPIFLHFLQAEMVSSAFFSAVSVRHD